MSALQGATLTTLCQNRYDLGYNIQNDTIPALLSTAAITRSMYVEAGHTGGSLEIHEHIEGVDVTTKVYPLVMHPLKSMVGKLSIPETLKGMKDQVNRFQ